MRKKQSKYTCSNFADMIRILRYRFRQSANEDLEDATGHAFLRGIEHFGSEFSMTKESLPWLLRVASNYLLDLRKNMALHLHVPLYGEDIMPIEQTHDSFYLDHKIDCSLFIKTLKRKEKITLCLYLKGLPPMKIAEELKISKDAVYKRLRKCRELFVSRSRTSLK